MSSKKLLMLAATTVAIAGLSASVYAGGPTTEMPVAAAAPSDTGFTLGTQYMNYADNNFGILGGYVNPDFLADLGFSYRNINAQTPGANSVNRYNLNGDLGLRYALAQSFYLTYGVNGYVGFGTNAPTPFVRPYMFGAFMGFDYQPISNILLSFKVDPYSYTRTAAKSYLNSVFTDGSIGASYVFAE